MEVVHDLHGGLKGTEWRTSTWEGCPLMPRSGSILGENFRANPAFEAQIKKTREYKEALEWIMEGPRGVAIVISPRRTGAYAGSFVIVREQGELRFGNTDFKAHWIEWGTVKMAGSHVLRRAVEMAGISLDVDSKP